jgi:hypothetical protein
MRTRPVVALLAVGALAACQGLKEALTAHTDVAARTVDQELSATRLGALIGSARIGIEPSKENAQIVADLWSDYQRLGYAAAHNDTLSSVVTKTIQPLIDNMRVSIMIDTLRSKVKIDTTNPEAGYNAAVGGILGARHILFAYPTVGGQPGTASPAQKDSVRKVANAIYPQITPANFSAMAKKYSGDPGSKDKGGSYGLFDRASMVPEFSNATASVKPGQITKPVESTYGIHIIQRLPYSEVKNDYVARYSEIAQRTADSSMSANLMSGGKLEVKDNAPAPIKDAIKTPASHKKDNTVVASFNGGDMSVAQFLGWLDVMPGNMRQQAMQVVPTWPDSQVKSFVKNMAMRQMLLKKADSAKIDVPATEKASLSVQFNQLVQNEWQQLNVTPANLAQAAKSQGDREKVAAARVDTLIAHMMNGESNPISIPVPLKSALDTKWDATISGAGIDRAVEIARKARASADSARTNQAPSQIPMPGAPQQPSALPPTAPAPSKTTKKKP